MEKIRIQKIIAEAGICSRRKAEEYIAAGRVKVNGRRISLGDKADLTNDLITIDGEKIETQREKHTYHMLYKPRGYISTMRDEKNRRCINDLIKDIPERVYPVGRLDVNSEGLLLLTNDGELSNKLLHPASKVKKTYRVTIRPDITDEQCAILSAGVKIDGKITAPCTLNVLKKEQGRVVLEIILKEGRNRQIRKMLDTQNIEVARLKRIEMGGVKLGMLQPGKHRELTDREIVALKNCK